MTDLFTWAAHSNEKKRRNLKNVQFGSRPKQRQLKEATKAALALSVPVDGAKPRVTA